MIPNIGNLLSNRFPSTPGALPHPGEQGAVLIIALIMLLILTLLGVTAMNMTSMEEKMATNIQESNQAFQAAETGISKAFDSPGSVDLSNPVTVDPAFIGGSSNLKSGYVTSFQGWSNPPLGSLYSATSFQSAHFDTAATGTTESGASVELHGGMYQIAPKM